MRPKPICGARSIMEAVRLKKASGVNSPCVNTVYNRIRRGMSPDEAMQPVVNISKAAREAGINVNTLYYRVTHGMSLQQALRCKVVSPRMKSKREVAPCSAQAC